MLRPPLVPEERRKSPSPFEINEVSSFDDDDERSLAINLGRVPAAMSAAAGASTAVIVCQDDGAPDKSSTSACGAEAASSWRSLARAGALGDEAPSGAEVVVEVEVEVEAAGVVVEGDAAVAVVVVDSTAGF